MQFVDVFVHGGHFYFVIGSKFIIQPEHWKCAFPILVPESR